MTSAEVGKLICYMAAPSGVRLGSHSQAYIMVVRALAITSMMQVENKSRERLSKGDLLVETVPLKSSS